MPRSRRLLAAAAIASILSLAAVASLASQPPELFSAVMQRVSADPKFHEKVLEGIRQMPRAGEFLSPVLLNRLRVLILGKEWQRVDHFPALTVAALNQSVAAASRIVGPAAKPLAAAELLDTADYSLERAQTIDLDHPATTPTYADDPATEQRQIGFHLTMGDGPDPALASMHPASRQLAAVLNRLAMNAPGRPAAVAIFNGKRYNSGAAFISALLAAGHTVTLTDDVYFANFGHLHDGGREVMMPFWIDTQIAVPASRRSLLVPVSHSEQELHVRGPRWNADVSFYFGIDGKAEFRTMDSLNQSWVMHRVLHAYADREREAHILELLSAAVRVYDRVRTAHLELPFGGYYRLGVCQDVGAAVERAMGEPVVLFPITHDPSYFPSRVSSDPRDQEFLTQFAAIPSDRGSGLPPVARVLGALPTTDYDAILIPGLGDDLGRVAVARRLGLTQRTHPLLTFLVLACAGLALLILVGWRMLRAPRRRLAHGPT